MTRGTRHGSRRPAAGVRVAAAALALALAAGAVTADDSGAAGAGISPATDGSVAPTPDRGDTPLDTVRDTVRLVGEEDVARRAWTFAPGERFSYSARYGRIKAGETTLEVEAVDTVDGTPAYRIARELEAGVSFCSIDNRDVSWVAPRPLRTLRFEQHKRECPSYELDRRYEFDHGESGSTWTMLNMYPADGGGSAEGSDNGSGEWRLETVKEDVATARNAIDDVAFLYLARMVPLEVGRTYRFDRYFQEDGNPVVIEVLRRETVRVPAGEFETVVLRPVIPTSGAFGEDSEAEVYITDDERRIPVQIKARLKIGSVNMYLREYEPGREDALFDAGG